MDDICTACLCTGRNLYFIGETGSYHLYSQILNEIPVYDFSDVCVRVCWECRAKLRRFGEFKTLVKRSYTELLQQVHQNVPITRNHLIRTPHLQIHHLCSLSVPDLDVKVERDCDALPLVVEIEVKQEQEIEEDETVKKKKNNKKTKENIKNKTKLKHKPKKKKQIQKKSTKKRKEDTVSIASEESTNFLNDNDSEIGCDDVHLDGDDVKEEKSEELLSKEEKMDELNLAEIKVNVQKQKNPNGKIIDKVPEIIGDKPKCPECGKMFSSKKTYRYHLNTLHKGQNRYPCPRCGKVYQWKSNLGRHMRSHKARDSGELYCEACDKRFASVATYRQHLKLSRRHVTENEFSFSCGECGKKFVNKTRLRDHVDWDHLHKVKFSCTLCHKPFKCHTSLYIHMQNVHRNKKKENLCHICGKSYQNAAKLKYHIVAMHTSETPYRCGACHAAFGWYSSLYRHTREVHHKMKLQPKKIRKSKRSTEA